MGQVVGVTEGRLCHPEQSITVLCFAAPLVEVGQQPGKSQGRSKRAETWRQEGDKEAPRG